MNRFLPLTAVLFCLLPPMLVCSKLAAQPIASATAQRPKYETPQACYEAFINLKEGNDPAAALSCYSEATVNYLAGNMAFNLQRFAGLSEAGDAPAACQKVLDKHGLSTVDLMGFLQIVDSPLPGGATPGFMQIGDSIQDKSAFFRDANAPMKQMQEVLAKARADSEKAGETPPAAAKENATAPKPPAAKLQNLKIDGDLAEGQVAPADDSGPSLPVFFKRENGSWVLAFANREPDWRKPIRDRFRFSDFSKQKP